MLCRFERALTAVRSWRSIDRFPSKNLMRLRSSFRKRHFFPIAVVAIAALPLVLDLIISRRRDGYVVVRLIRVAAGTRRCCVGRVVRFGCH
jgi:hypothetical protein